MALPEGAHDDIGAHASIHRNISVRIVNGLAGRIIVHRLSDLLAGRSGQADADIIVRCGGQYCRNTDKTNETAIQPSPRKIRLSIFPAGSLGMVSRNRITLGTRYSGMFSLQYCKNSSRVPVASSVKAITAMTV